MPKREKDYSIPRALLIGRRKWRVYVEPETSDHRVRAANGKWLADERKPLDGRTYFAPREIHVSGTLTPREQFHTFVHELLHATLEDAWHASERAEERLVRAIEPGLAEWIAVERAERAR